MSKRIDCPACGATCNANAFAREGCWSCNQRSEEVAKESAFQMFMQHDEEARWRIIFERLQN